MRRFSAQLLLAVRLLLFLEIFVLLLCLLDLLLVLLDPGAAIESEKSPQRFFRAVASLGLLLPHL